MDTIDMLVEKYFPNSPPQKRWLMLDIAKALNLQPEQGEEEHELVYYKLQDYPVILEELRDPWASPKEKRFLFVKFFNEIRKWVRADHRLNVDDVEEVWYMANRSLPVEAVRSYIQLLKTYHRNKTPLMTRERIRLIRLALRCERECPGLTPSDLHNFIFALCNFGVRDGIDLPAEIQSDLSRFILLLKNMYIDAISLRHWKQIQDINFKIRDYSRFKYHDEAELKFIANWLQTPIHFEILVQNKTEVKYGSVARNISSIPKLLQAFNVELRPDVKFVLADNLLTSYDYVFHHMGPSTKNTLKIVLLVVHGVGRTTKHQNNLILSILNKCIDVGEPCFNVSRKSDLVKMNIILENMNLSHGSSLKKEVARKLKAAAKKAGLRVDPSLVSPRSSQWSRVKQAVLVHSGVKGVKG
uniref:Uncharacterized protein n=1 Tax=Ornithodoros turicata TaxID=34597 RepID=A0A2R5L7X5_9ACAR